MKYEDLTPQQEMLHDEVVKQASVHGTDTRDLLRLSVASWRDKAAVAEVLGGPGAGTEFIQ